MFDVVLNVVANRKWFVKSAANLVQQICRKMYAELSVLLHVCASCVTQVANLDVCLKVRTKHTACCNLYGKMSLECLLLAVFVLNVSCVGPNAFPKCRNHVYTHCVYHVP